MMYVNSENKERIYQAIINGEMNKLIAKVEDHPKYDKGLCKLVIKSIDAAIGALVSPELIERGARLLRGDQFLAMAVIASTVDVVT